MTRLCAVLLVASACGAPAKPTAAPPPPASPPPAPPTKASTDDAIVNEPSPEEAAKYGGLTSQADISSGFDDHPSPPPKHILPQVGLESPEIRGNLEKAVLRRYMTEKIQHIARCYEQELAGNPALNGTVTVDFMITASDGVATATATGMAKVDACIAAEVKKIQFMRPHDGATVQVIWPIKLSSRAY
jgi:hypothetical protein